MYRLIAPVVDYANSTMGLTVYFEFNQTSEHKTSQSVDIALLEGTQPKVMIEAKRVDRPIAAEQIYKYLRPGVRGLVTNGVHWVMCLNGESKAVRLHHVSDGKTNVASLSEIVGFIRAEPCERRGWSAVEVYVDPSIKPLRPSKTDRAHRQKNTVEVATDTIVLRGLFNGLTAASHLESTLLDSMLHQFEDQGALPGHLHAKVRASRVSFFDSRLTSKSTRVARIELGKRQPDVLVHSGLVSSWDELARIASPAPHDKGSRMRRFRLSDETQTRDFGVALAKVLSSHNL